MDKDSKLYEVAYLISPAYSEDETRTFHQSLKNTVQELGGLIDHEGEVIKRRLSYPIKKMTEAHLLSFRFMLAPEKISELKTKLGSKEVLKFLLVGTKRQPARIYRPRPEKITTQDGIVYERKIKTAQPTSDMVPQQQSAPAAEPTNIEEIDKKLEEILGK